MLINNITLHLNDIAIELSATMEKMESPQFIE